MTTSDSHPFAALDGEQFLLLTTYRKTGEAAPTPVWFAERDGRIYITTGSAAGKLKRIRNNPEVVVAPSDRVGAMLGPAFPARAREATLDERATAEAALSAKYGEELKRIRAMRSGESGSTYLVVTSPTE